MLQLFPEIHPDAWSLSVQEQIDSLLPIAVAKESVRVSEADGLVPAGIDAVP
jgi:hypothetical protein